MNQSPYIRAYEAGIKLAQLEFRSKVADPKDGEEGGAEVTTIPEEEPAATQQTREQLVAKALSLNNAILNNDRNNSRPAQNREFRAAHEQTLKQIKQLGSQSAPAPISIAEEPFGDPSMSMSAPSAGVSSLTLDPKVQDWVNRARSATPQESQPAPAPATQFPGTSYLRELHSQGIGDGLPDYGNLGQYIVDKQPQAPQSSTPAPAPQEQQEEAPKPFNFNVVSGGYGKQFKALQDQFKERGQAGALEGFNYRDMAQAMGNRGLRVDDRFDANALLQRMKNIQDQGMGVMDETQFNVQRMQGRGQNRGYQNIGNFQNLSQQRAAGQRRQQQQRQQAQSKMKPPQAAVNPAPNIQEQFKKQQNPSGPKRPLPYSWI